MRVQQGKTRRMASEMCGHQTRLPVCCPPGSCGIRVKPVSWEIVNLVLSGICVTLKDGGRWGKGQGLEGRGGGGKVQWSATQTPN